MPRKLPSGRMSAKLERALLHCAGKIIQVDLAVEQNHSPVGVGGGHRAAQVF